MGKDKDVVVIESLSIAIIMLLQSLSWKCIEDFRNIHVVVSMLVLTELSTVLVFRLDEHAHELNANRSGKYRSVASLANVPIHTAYFPKREHPSILYFHHLYPITVISTPIYNQHALWSIPKPLPFTSSPYCVPSSPRSGPSSPPPQTPPCNILHKSQSRTPPS